MFLSADPGFYYHVLGIATFCLSAHSAAREKEALASEALFYYTKGLNSVNSRLDDGLERQRNGVIVSIMGLAVHAITNTEGLGWCWESSAKCPARAGVDEWALHLNAIKTILDSRGGVTTIDSDFDLRRWLML